MSSVASSISRPKRRSGLSVPKRRHRLGVRHPRERRLELDADGLEPRRRSAPSGRAGTPGPRTPSRRRAAELELPVGAEILVAEAHRDLVVAVEPADHEQLLHELRRLRQRVEAARLEPQRDEEVARALGVPASEDRRLDVDEAGSSMSRRIARTICPRRRRLRCSFGRAGRASGSAGARCRRRSPRRAGTAAASSARGSRASRPAPRSRRSAGSGSRARARARRPRPRAWTTNSLRSSCAGATASAARSGLTTS